MADYWQKTVDKTIEKWRFAEVDYSSAYNDFGGFLNAPSAPVPSLPELPHATIDPSALRAAKERSLG
jgi:hypothetical protein